jgi:hypothetical protein
MVIAITFWIIGLIVFMVGIVGWIVNLITKDNDAMLGYCVVFNIGNLIVQMSNIAIICIK